MAPSPDQLPADLGEGQAYYQFLSRDGDTATYRSTIHAQGAWNVGEQHMAPATGVLTHEMLAFQAREGVRLVRLSLDIIGFIPGGEFTVTTRMVRPGRTIELVESVLEAHGRTSIIARGWRLQTGDTAAIEAVQEPGIPGPDQTAPWEMGGLWGGGYIGSLDGRRDPESTPGHARAWLTNSLPMVAGEDTADVVKLLGMVDTANGISQALHPSEWLFPNVDLQIHLFREPQGQWLGYETMQSVGADGVGLTSSVLHDAKGPFGRAEQILTIRPMPKSSN
ncbi:thioesterase family protein [Galactobacter caseinivorans]|uniref:Thioesterase family protein n=1 Tax=Galactobacter caseinivorans TaxID=2676123 RepID=A0A496PH50_9MICC|nr:thioesterase family protein [Galactobacter caseinivorans]RKW69808.1 thioesterase family protein [Galactobacter caseinivorans]